MLEVLPTGLRPHPTAALSVFDEPAYVAASARHEGSTAAVARADGAALVLLQRPDGLRTVYGYPALLADAEAEIDVSAEALARALAGLDAPAVIAPSPLGPSVRLADALSEVAVPQSVRPLACFVACDDMGGDDERVLAGHASRTRRAIRTARRRGAMMTIAPLDASFGPFYRAAMDDLDAAPIYRFDDTYFDALRALRHFQVTVADDHGPAAQALFLLDARAGYYHLGGRRSKPEAVLGAMNLALHGGIVECLRRGRATVVLGGGRSLAMDDPLLVFKRQMAPELLSRPVFSLAPALAGRRA